MLLWIACIGKDGPSGASGPSGDSGVEQPEPRNTVIVLDASPSLQDETAALVLALEQVEKEADRQWAVMTVDGDKGGAFMREPSEDPGEALLAVACDAACWDPDSLPSDPDWTCGEPVTEITVEALDCICALDDWEGHCGSGVEEPLEAIYGALCRATDGCGEFDVQAGLLGIGVDTEFVVFTDEGDSSRRLDLGDGSAQAYLDLYAATGQPYTISVMGPDGSLQCNDGGATSWGVERLQEAAEESGGDYESITDDACDLADIPSFVQSR